MHNFLQVQITIVRENCVFPPFLVIFIWNMKFGVPCFWMSPHGQVRLPEGLSDQNGWRNPRPYEQWQTSKQQCMKNTAQHLSKAMLRWQRQLTKNIQELATTKEEPVRKMKVSCQPTSIGSAWFSPEFCINYVFFLGGIRSSPELSRSAVSMDNGYLVMSCLLCGLQVYVLVYLRNIPEEREHDILSVCFWAHWQTVHNQD